MKWFFVAILCPSLVFGQLPPPISPHNPVQLHEYLRRLEIFNETLDLCSGGWNTVAVTNKYLYESLKETTKIAILGDHKAIINLVENNGISPALRETLQSNGFYDALDVCFANKVEKILFMSNLIAADVTGKVFGGIGAYYVGLNMYLSMIRLEVALGFPHWTENIYFFGSLLFTAVTLAKSYYVYHIKKELEEKAEELFPHHDKSNFNRP